MNNHGRKFDLGDVCSASLPCSQQLAVFLSHCLSKDLLLRNLFNGLIKTVVTTYIDYCPSPSSIVSTDTPFPLFLEEVMIDYMAFLHSDEERYHFGFLTVENCMSNSGRSNLVVAKVEKR